MTADPRRAVVRASAGTPHTETAILEVHDLEKSFDGVPVLRQVDLTIEHGEVHALLGANGSGKSTLIKILSGYHSADAGTIVFEGSASGWAGSGLPPHDRSQLPLAFVHQDLGLLPNLSVSENFHLRRLATPGVARLIRWPELNRQTAEMLHEFGVDLSPTQRVLSLSPVERALLAILRSYCYLRQFFGDAPSVLVLDEPTVFLPVDDRHKVWDLVRAITARQGAVLLVSHDLTDVRAIADRVTVLRDGRVAATLAAQAASDRDLLQLLAGEALAGGAAAPPASHIALSVPDPSSGIRGRDLRTKALRRVSVAVAGGEILGVTGLPGSGYDELPYALYGSLDGDGTISVGKTEYPVARLTPGRARQLGVALVPADRGTQGAFSELSASENLAVPVLAEHLRRGMLSTHRMRERFARAAAEYRITPADPAKSLRMFSGGNQQKIVVAKWLQAQPRVLLLHEPTQGVDVRAKQDLIIAIANATASGIAVIWASIDQGDLAQACDRILVFRDGLIIRELRRPFTRRDIVEATYA